MVIIQHRAEIWKKKCCVSTHPTQVAAKEIYSDVHYELISAIQICHICQATCALKCIQIGPADVLEMKN